MRTAQCTARSSIRVNMSSTVTTSVASQSPATMTPMAWNSAESNGDVFAKWLGRARAAWKAIATYSAANSTTETVEATFAILRNRPFSSETSQLQVK